MKVLIIGGGAAGYFAAIRYKKVFSNFQIDLVQSKNINIIGVGESSLLDIPRFLIDDCEIDINDFHEEVKPTFKLGLQTRDWSEKGKIINYTFDIINLMYKNGLDFLDNIDNENYTFFSNLFLSKKPPITINKQLLVGNIKDANHFQHYLHAYQLENKKFIPFLKKQAKIKGVNEIEGEIKKIKHNGKKIEEIFFNENWHEYDFYIDCSGFNGCITKYIENKWISFENYLPCDSSIVGEHELNENPNQYTVAHAMSNGWMFQIDTYGRTGKGYIYNSSTISEEMAIEEYMIKNEYKIKNHRKIKFNSGFYKNIFNENYCLVGNSAGFAEPLESTGYNAILNTINLLIKNHKDKKNNLSLTKTEINCNNLYIEKFWYEVINFILIHYKFNHNYDNEFWNYCYNLNFHGDFNEIIKYLIENKFSLSKKKEIAINYSNITFPVEFAYALLKGKNVIKKENKIDKEMITNFKNKTKEIMSYDDMIKEKDYKKYYENKISINDFLNY